MCNKKSSPETAERFPDSVGKRKKCSKTNFDVREVVNDTVSTVEKFDSIEVPVSQEEVIETQWVTFEFVEFFY